MSEVWEPKTDDDLGRDRETLDAQVGHYRRALLDTYLVGEPGAVPVRQLSRAGTRLHEQVDAFMAATLEHHVDEWQRETVRRVFSDGFDARNAWIRPRSYGRRWIETVLPTGPGVDERVRADFAVRCLLDEVATFGVGYQVHREDWSWTRRRPSPVAQDWTDHLAEITGAG